MTIEDRLRNTIEQLARQHPLDLNLIATVAAGLPDRPSRSNHSLRLVAATAVMMAAAAVVVAALGLIGPGGLPSGSVPTGSPQSSPSNLGQSVAPSAASPSEAIGLPVSAPPLGSGNEATCENADVGYRLSYPADWYVHPADLEQGISSCALFAAEPFTYRPDEPPGFGASVYLIDSEGSCLEFDGGAEPDRLEAVTVGGLPAYRIETGADTFLPEAYLYVVNLRPDAGDVLGGAANGSCDGVHALYLRADGGGPGDYVMNKRIIDRIATTLVIDR